MLSPHHPRLSALESLDPFHPRLSGNFYVGTMENRFRRLFRARSRPPKQESTTSLVLPDRTGSSHASTSKVSLVSKGDLWEDALDRLPEADRDLVLKYSLSNANGSNVKPNAMAYFMPDVLLEAAQKKRELCEEKKWRFELRNGHIVSLKETADRIISWLDKVKTVGDVAVSADPLHAALPWAGIKVLLIVSTIISRLEIILIDLQGCNFRESAYGVSPYRPRKGALPSQSMQSL